MDGARKGAHLVWAPCVRPFCASGGCQRRSRSASRAMSMCCGLHGFQKLLQSAEVALGLLLHARCQDALGELEEPTCLSLVAEGHRGPHLAGLKGVGALELERS